MSKRQIEILKKIVEINGDCYNQAKYDVLCEDCPLEEFCEDHITNEKVVEKSKRMLKLYKLRELKKLLKKKKR